jgi:hypothetical protein
VNVDVVLSMTGFFLLPEVRTSLKRTHVLIPLSKALLKKPTGSQLVKKFPVFYGTRRFITSFTSARHMSLSRAPTSHILKIRLSVILQVSVPI